MNFRKSFLLLLCIAQLSFATLQFDKNFIFGFSSSHHQIEGDADENDSWTQWEQTLFPDGTPHVKERSGKACDHWNRYKEDIALLKTTGADAFKFSVAWSKIEPQEGRYSKTALDHYEDVCKELVSQGIKPVLTLHHYTDPQWFLDKGGFEKEENLHHFVKYCAKVFERLHPYVFIWITFTSPSAYATKGYLNGMVPPGKKNMQLMGEVLKNILEGHVQVYHALKAINPAPSISFSKNIYQLEPWNNFNPLDHIAAGMGNLITNTTIYNFVTTGIFKLHIPGLVNVYHENPKAPQSLDFIALNYYSHAYMKNFKVTLNPDEIHTQNPQYTLYPEGMYRAIKEIDEKIAKPLNIPIYITENGVATDLPEIRLFQSEGYLQAIAKAMQEGCDVRSYIHWALLDNYEWGNYDKHYGIYKVDYQTQERTLKPGTEYLLSVIKKSKEVAS